jgi:hypothetical protein
MAKEFYKLEELTPIIGLTKEEILETIDRHKIKVKRYISGNYMFTDDAIKKIEKKYWEKWERRRAVPGKEAIRLEKNFIDKLKKQQDVVIDSVQKTEAELVRRFESTAYKLFRRKLIAAEKKILKKEKASKIRIEKKAQAVAARICKKKARVKKRAEEKIKVVVVKPTIKPNLIKSDSLWYPGKKRNMSGSNRPGSLSDREEDTPSISMLQESMTGFEPVLQVLQT